MAFNIGDFNGMDLLWEQIQKDVSGKAILTSEDVDSMWNCGIVDAGQFSLEIWRGAFDEHSLPDGTFKLSKKEFLAKEKYRYKGEIMVPFDATMINEGKYTDEGLNELFEASIKPSCSLSPAKLEEFLDDIKNEFRGDENLIKIGADAKVKIRDMIEANPSPLRRLELMFDYLIKQTEQEGFENLAPEDVSPEQLVKIQASSFSIQPISEAEEQWQALTKVEKRVYKTPVAEGKTGTTIKKVKRSRKGLRG